MARDPMLPGVLKPCLCLLIVAGCWYSVVALGISLTLLPR
jgi:hypothetical protein